ncbi:GLPGLI family protein [Croceivirga thetidis]|uniref:GLPGLI family protein n=1 Tax=Croceivirga thetidis TaxID=2721623 RepID=A0ABX1GQ38_9FLAO|nr:GLPGLI family protein [Croceivirga thetidis]NKI31803.1 GLPGLI family protein [Croceivirga thetidis]
MKKILLPLFAIVVLLIVSFTPNTQEFQGQAIYLSKSTMELGNWGARMSEAQKKQIKARLKNRLEKTYTLNFNKEESVFNEEEKLDAISGATDSWGKNFARGEQYKNVKANELVQTQEFYGKKFLVKDGLQEFDWNMGSETKQIGQYMCFKASALVPTDELTWFDFSWGKLRRQQAQQNDSTATTPEIDMTQVVAWYTPQIPVSHGPAEYWGLPGLILEVNAGNTTMLCSKIIMNPKDNLKIVAPDKGKIVDKTEYQVTVLDKMKEMMENRGRRRSR